MTTERNGVMGTRAVVSAALVAALAGAATPALAQREFTWKGGQNRFALPGSWNEAGGPPSLMTDTAIVGHPTLGARSLVDQWVTSGRVVVQGGAAAGRVDVLPFARLRVNALENQGEVVVNPGESTGTGVPTIAFSGAGAALTGAGVLRMFAPTALTQAQIVDGAVQGEPRTTLVHGVGHTIAGSGTIGIALDNRGVVRADQAGRTLRLGGTLPVANSGTLSALGGGVLSLFDAPVTQSAEGTILLYGGVLDAFRSSVTGGRLLVTAGSEVRAAFLALDGVDIDLDGGEFVVLPGTTTLRNVPDTGGGRYVLRPGSSTATLVLDQPTVLLNSDVRVGDGVSATWAALHIGRTGTVLEGSGEIRLDAAASNVAGAGIGGQPFVLAGPTLRGSGRVSVGVSNRVQIVADREGRTLELLGGMPANDGVVRAEGGGVLALRGVIRQGVDGSIVAGPGSVVRLDAQLNGGRLVVQPADSAGSAGRLRVVNAQITGTEVDLRGTLLELAEGNVNLNQVPGVNGPIAVRGGRTLTINTPTFLATHDVVINSDGAASTALVQVAAPMFLGGPGDVVLHESGAAGSRAWLSVGSQSAGLTLGWENALRGRGVVSGFLRTRGLVSPGGAGAGTPGGAVHGEIRFGQSSTLDLTVDSVVEMDVSGVGAFDRVVRDGTWTPTYNLAGTLRVRQPAGAPGLLPGERVQLMDAWRVHGRFANHELPTPGMGAYTVEYTATGVWLVNAQPRCVADLNLDGELTFDDIQLFIVLYNAGDARADLNSDEEWTFDDIQLLVTAYNGGC